MSQMDDDVYNIDKYTDEELIHLLDLQPNSTDREIEAKIILNINKYNHMDTQESQQLLLFFENIYSRLFEIENVINIDEKSYAGSLDNVETDIDTEVIKEGMVTMSMTTKPEAKSEAKSEAKPDKIANTNIISYNFDNQNPILKQTIKRIITIDSQYRDNKGDKNNKGDISTDFTFSLSDPLRNVVSLKLYSVHVPFTWYTINNAYGSNLFYIKGISPGIDDGNFDYPIQIPAGNYTNKSIIEAVNKSITTMKSTYTDVSFGLTEITYNENTGIANLTIDINDQYNETSYYLQFDTDFWIQPTDTNKNERKKSIPGFLGFDVPDYYPNNKYYSYTTKSDTFNTLTSNELNLVRTYTLTSTNNYFTVYKYTDSNSTFSLTESNIDISFNINFSLATNLSYTTNELLNDLNTQIATNKFLNPNYSHIRLKSTNHSSLYQGKSYFELALKCNRSTTKNIAYSKLAIIFPTETIINNTTSIWSGSNSCFKFKNYTQEMNTISSDTTSLESTNSIFVITTTPTIQLRCIKPGYIVNSNDYTITLNNNFNGYTLTEYIANINNAIETTNNNTKTTTNITGDFYIPNSLASIDANNKINITLDTTKIINKTNFILDLNNSFLSTVMKFNTTYDLYQTQGTITSTFYYASSFNVLGKVASFYANSTATNINENVTISVNNNTINTVEYKNLRDTVLNFFTSYVDSNNNKIFSGTNFELELNNNIITAHLTINIAIPLSQKDYSIQFIDFNNINQDNFILQNTTTSFLQKLGFNNTTNTLSGGNNVITFYTTVNNSYDFTGSTNINLTIISRMIADALDTSQFYNYNIQPPSNIYNNTNISTNLTNLQNDINTQLRLHSDLTGSNIAFRYTPTIGSVLTITLTIVINQKYYLNLANSTWYNNLKINPIVISQPYDLNNILNNVGQSYTEIKGYIPIEFNFIDINSSNNTFYIIPYENGIISEQNKYTITIPIRNNYNIKSIIETINLEFKNNPDLSKSTIFIDNNGYTIFKLLINKKYTSKDYSVSFFDADYFIKCSISINTTIENATWDTTLGWFLGFRKYKEYVLSDYYVIGTDKIQIIADTCVDTTVLNYFFISLDDYNLNRLNDGLVTITTSDKTIATPAYVNNKSFICDPVTRKKTYNTLNTNGFNRLTNNQIYAMTEIVNSTNVIDPYTTNPYIQDTFGIIPLKLGGTATGSVYSEFGGSLQNQERTYFGPVNISKMKVKLLSDKGKIIDLNGSNWTFSLLCEQIYKKEPSK